MKQEKDNDSRIFACAKALLIFHVRHDHRIHVLTCSFTACSSAKDAGIELPRLALEHAPIGGFSRG